MRQPHWKSYKNAETLEFFHLFLQITETYDLSALRLNETMKPLETIFKELEKAFRHPKKSVHTASLVQLDQDRNRGLRAIKKAIDFNLLHFKVDKILAAQNIEAVFIRFGALSIQDLKYSSKTATIRNLVRALLNNSELLKDLKLLDLEELVIYLQEKNESFEDTFLERTRNQGKVKSFQEVKTALIKEYRMFIKTLEARAFLDESLNYHPLITEINNLVSKFNYEVKLKVKTSKQEVFSPQLKSKLTVSYRKDRWKYKPQNSPVFFVVDSPIPTKRKSHKTNLPHPPIANDVWTPIKNPLDW